MGLKKIILLIYDERCQNLMAAIEGCQNELTVENVHQMRTKTRRINYMVDVFYKYVRGKRVKEIKKYLKPTVKAFGDLRDLQLQISYLEDLRLEESILASYKNILLTKKSKKEVIARKAVEEINLEFLDDLLCIFRKRLEEALKGKKNRKILVKKLKKDSGKIYNKVNQKREALVIDNPNSFHTLRKKYKKFRYTMEIMAPVYHIESIQLEAMKKVQEALGDIQDLNVRLKEMKTLHQESNFSLEKLMLENEQLIVSKMKEFYNQKDQIKTIWQEINKPESQS